MARNRVIYQSEALYVSRTGTASQGCRIDRCLQSRWQRDHYCGRKTEVHTTCSKRKLQFLD